MYCIVSQVLYDDGDEEWVDSTELSSISRSSRVSPSLINKLTPGLGVAAPMFCFAFFTVVEWAVFFLEFMHGHISTKQYSFIIIQAPTNTFRGLVYELQGSVCMFFVWCGVECCWVLFQVATVSCKH